MNTLEKFNLKKSNAVLLFINMLLIVAGLALSVVAAFRLWPIDPVTAARPITDILVYLCIILFATTAWWKLDGGKYYRALVYPLVAHFFLSIVITVMGTYWGTTPLGVELLAIPARIVAICLLLVIIYNLKSRKTCLILFGIITIMELVLAIYLISTGEHIAALSPFFMVATIGLCYATNLDKRVRAGKE